MREEGFPVLFFVPLWVGSMHKYSFVHLSNPVLGLFLGHCSFLKSCYTYTWRIPRASKSAVKHCCVMASPLPRWNVWNVMMYSSCPLYSWFACLSYEILRLLLFPLLRLTELFVTPSCSLRTSSFDPSRIGDIARTLFASLLVSSALLHLSVAD